ncbi:MAG: B12-binding domain-containing radical SAM protein [Methanosarcinales archaeon]
MAEILCINPSTPEGILASEGSAPYLGIAYIGAVLEKHGYSVGIIDAPIENIDLKKLIEKHDPSVTCISGTTPRRFDSFKIAKISKELLPETITIYGGPHATFTAEDPLNKVPWIDIIVRGEGELTILELVKALLSKNPDLKNILGISYRKNNKVCNNPPRPQIKNLDELPFPAYHLFDIDQYNMKLYLDLHRKSDDNNNIHRALNIITSRGCTNRCTFCAACAMWKRVTTRSPKNVIDEIEELVNTYGIDGINFVDSTLTLHKDHILGICNEIKERHLDIAWFCEARVNTINKNILEKMKNAGCTYIQVGVESGSPRILKKIKKNINIEQVKQVAQWSKEVGLRIRASFMFGLPEETYEDAITTVQLIHELKKMDIDYGANATIIYPGTEVESFAREKGYLPPFLTLLR